MTEFYGEDVAYVHDTGFSDFATHAAKMIIKTLNDQLESKGLVIDLVCGSGVVAKELVNNHYNVLGIDQSEELIKLAKTKCPGGKFL